MFEIAIIKKHIVNASLAAQFLLSAVASMIFVLAIYLLQQEINGPTLNNKIEYVDSCAKNNESSNWRFRKAVWSTGDGRYAIRSEISPTCELFKYESNDIVYLLTNYGKGADNYTISIVSEEKGEKPLIPIWVNEHIKAYALNPIIGKNIKIEGGGQEKSGALTIAQVYISDKLGTQSTWNQGLKGRVEQLFYDKTQRKRWGIVFLTFICLLALLAWDNTRKSRIISAFAFCAVAALNNIVALHFSSDDYYTLVIHDAISSSNLGYTVDAVNSLRQGIVDEFVLNPYRKPLYFLIAAALSLIVGPNAHDFVSIYVSLTVGFIGLHLVSYFILCVVLFSHMSKWSALVSAAVLSTLSISSNYVQVDTIIVSIYYFLLACVISILYSNKYSFIGVSSGLNIFLMHLVFATLSFVRSEWLIIWVVCSIFLHRGSLRCYFFPLCCFSLMLLIQGALFKVGTGAVNFKFGTNNTGHVAFIGLFDNDTHPFKWEPLDASYDEWISGQGYRYKTEEANKFATPEIIQFYATFPYYVVWNTSRKLLGYLNNRIGWTATQDGSLFPSRKNILTKYGKILFILTICLVVFDKSNRLLFIALPAFIGALIFSVLQQSGGRFTTYVTEILLFVCIVGFFDMGRRLMSREFILLFFKILTGFVLYFLIVYGVWTIWPESILWAPLLDPVNSTLYQFK